MGKPKFGFFTLFCSCALILGMAVTGQTQEGPDVYAPQGQQAEQGTGMGTVKSVIPVDSILGEEIYFRDGREAGEIKDVYADRATGKIIHATVEVGGFLGIGGKYYLVPWDSIKPQQDRLILDIPRDKFQSSPALEGSDFERTDGLDAGWIRKSYEYYDYKPEGVRTMFRAGT